ncbi:L,D-transpeptidase [Falsirhodobacter halotolerans]|uniref:L,D-transpeptidase n=1 Tax=Falsirhodobacter halotolerans TaxID=1146892 RepID=UPI001FD3CBD9|nr:L,D-transpeptidase [Falsirhodobacter halotolerans]MCJ8139732.1 L,D-transpeptidase [Falsirhodobacter halotolerans]
MTQRRTLMLGGLALLATPTVVRAQVVDPSIRANVSSFKTQRWQDHFDSLGQHGAIVADFTSRALHWWSADGRDYRLYPSSIPMSEELTRRGYTEIVRKRVGPDWRPTADMRRRDPSLPDYVGPGPDNPLGTHAMYLSWPAYIIHGTHDTRKIGRPSSSGCVGLYNEHVEELFALAPIGTQVRLV